MKQESKEVSNVSDGENLRIQAIIWWHDLDFDEREKYYDGYKKWTPAKDHTQLTGREIQNIWAVAMNPPEPKEEPVSISVEEAATETLEERIKGYSFHDAHLFSKGANWQKEQDKLLVEDMLDVIRMFHATMTAKDYTERAFKAVESAITKATNYLSK